MPSVRSEWDLPVHPVLASLDEDDTGFVALEGYVGPHDDDESTRLYSSLADLTQSVVVNHADIVHVDELPASGAVRVWVRVGSTVTQRVERARTASAGRRVLTGGRLQIRAPRGRAGGGPADICIGKPDICIGKPDICIGKPEICIGETPHPEICIGRADICIGKTGAGGSGGA